MKKRIAQALMGLLAVTTGSLIINEVPVYAEETKDTIETTDSDYQVLNTDDYEFVKDENGIEAVQYTILPTYAVKGNVRNMKINSVLVSGKIKVPANKEGENDHIYSYSGELGSTVNAISDDENAPLVKVKIPNLISFLNAKTKVVRDFGLQLMNSGEDENVDIYDGFSNDSNVVGKMAIPTDTSTFYIAEAGREEVEPTRINGQHTSIGNFYFGIKSSSGSHELKGISWIKQTDDIEPSYAAYMDQSGETPQPSDKIVETGSYVSNVNDGREVLQKTTTTADVTIPTTKDGKDTPQVVENVTGNIGDTIDIKVPQIEGYTSNVPTVKATVTATGIILNEGQTVTYTKEAPKPTPKPTPTHHNSTHHKTITTEQLGYGYLNQTVATYPDQSNAKLYSLSGTTFTPVTDQALASASNWFTDQMITYKNKRYYRVATNKWVQSTSAYVYESTNKTYKADKLTHLVDARGNKITNRALAADTSWKIDQIAYLGNYQNPTKAYRVATNEFVIIE